MKNIILEELKAFSDKKLPIQSAHGALNYAMSIQAFVAALKDAETRERRTIQWHVISQRLTDDTPESWEVSAKSTGTLIACRASLSLNASGEIISQFGGDYVCVYLK